MIDSFPTLKMKSILRRKQTSGGEDVDFDDGKSVRSTATSSTAAAIKIGAGFIKRHTPFRMGRHHTQAESIPDETEENGVIAERDMNVSANSINLKMIPGSDDGSALRLRIRELQVDLDGEKRKNQQFERAMEQEQASNRKKLAELQSLLDRERENYHSIASGGDTDETVRRQAETLQEYQALIDALQLRLDQLQEEYTESEKKCEMLEQSSQVATVALKERLSVLEAENAKLKKSLDESGSTENSKKHERESEILRQRLVAMEAENVKLKKSLESGGSKPSKNESEKLKTLEQENMELKRMSSIEVDRSSALQNKIIGLERELSTFVHRANAESDVALVKTQLVALQSRFAEKEAELASIATTAEAEIERLEQLCQSQARKKDEAEEVAKVLQLDLIKIKGDMAKQSAYWKEKLEHDEHYQRATDAARQLLKQKKISKAEFDQVIKAAQEAARVWNE